MVYKEIIRSAELGNIRRSIKKIFKNIIIVKKMFVANINYLIFKAEYENKKIKW